jgi:hypothetical protein
MTEAVVSAMATMATGTGASALRRLIADILAESSTLFPKRL